MQCNFEIIETVILIPLGKKDKSKKFLQKKKQNSF